VADDHLNAASRRETYQEALASLLLSTSSGGETSENPDSMDPELERLTTRWSELLHQTKQEESDHRSLLHFFKSKPFQEPSPFVKESFRCVLQTPQGEHPFILGDPEETIDLPISSDAFEKVQIHRKA